uniref:Uncharacterized protein n=1 Tax=Electrophorus electricus TaxID=8005 RepID=A0AAY5EH65_ELEEL
LDHIVDIFSFKICNHLSECECDTGGCECGFAGFPGDRGTPGNPGFRGLRGLTGPQGIGVPGPIGVRGLAGKPGQQGSPGVTGLKGIRGKGQKVTIKSDSQSNNSRCIVSIGIYRPALYCFLYQYFSPFFLDVISSLWSCRMHGGNDVKHALTQHTCSKRAVFIWNEQKTLPVTGANRTVWLPLLLHSHSLAC